MIIGTAVVTSRCFLVEKKRLVTHIPISYKCTYTYTHTCINIGNSTETDDGNKFTITI